MSKLWTQSEDKVLSNTSLPYDNIFKLLPHRSKYSIWTRAAKLGYVRDVEVIQKVNSENQRNDTWTELLDDKEFCEIVDGELLGDGCIFRKKVKNRQCYEYSFIAGSIQKEYAKYVHSILSKKLCSKAKIKTIKPNLDKKSGFMSYRNFYSYRFSNVLFRKFYDRWYPKGSIKTTIPDDLVLTPTSCLHWHLGDGWLHVKSITLQTNNFDKKSVNALAELLKQEMDITPKVAKEKEKYFIIRLGVRDSKIFLKYVGKSPVKSMAYKWVSNNGR